MEEKLTPEQRDRLFGVGDGPTADDYREFRLALGKIDGEITKELGQSMKWAVTNLGDARDSSRMNPEQQIAYAQLRHGFEIADEQGWDKNEVWKSALQGAAARFSPEDAAFMLRQFMKPESTIPAGPTAKIVSDDSCTRRLEERDPCAGRRDDPHQCHT